MSLKIIDYKPWHLRFMDLQPKQREWLERYPTLPDHLQEASDYIGTVIDSEGACAAVMGATMIHPTCLDVWAFIANNFRRNGLALTKRAAEYLNEFSDMGFTRIQSMVQPEFNASRRWMGMLGFKEEGLFRKMLPDGSDAFVYSIVEEV